MLSAHYIKKCQTYNALISVLACYQLKLKWNRVGKRCFIQPFCQYVSYPDACITLGPVSVCLACLITAYMSACSLGL